MRDHRLPETENELRDWLVEAWQNGWKARAAAVGRPMGTVIRMRQQKRDEFLRSWDLEPPPEPPIDPRPAGRILAEAYPSDLE